MSKKIKRITALIFFVGIIIITFILINLPKDDFTVTFIDVGQGDSALISGRDSNILIDAGTLKNARSVRAVLDRKNVKRLDLVILSHLDSDHISGMSELIGEYEISKIFMPDIKKEYLPSSTSLDELNVAVGNKNIPVYKVKAGNNYSVKEIKVSVLSPSKEYKDSNDDSAVVRIKCGSKHLMFTGDISSKAEADILSNYKDLSADILKVAHHGSRTSTSSEFLEAVNPSFAVVSVSEYNDYNLPNLETMNRLYGFGCKVYRTDETGSVTFHIKGGKIDVETEKA